MISIDTVKLKFTIQSLSNILNVSVITIAIFFIKPKIFHDINKYN